MRAALALLAAVLVGPGCVTATWTKLSRHREVQGDDELQPGRDDLAACLARLGAPLIVRENGDGAVMAWGWAKEQAWGVTVYVPLKSAEVSFAYDRGLFGLTGVVLFFDHLWQLTAIERGSLAEILPPSQVRAQLVE